MTNEKDLTVLSGSESPKDQTISRDNIDNPPEPTPFKSRDGLPGTSQQKKGPLPMDLSDIRKNLPPIQVRDPYQASLPSAQHSGVLPEKFDGSGFKTWSEKMLFFLAKVGLDRYLTETRPVVTANDLYAQSNLEAWDKGDFMCRGYIRARLVDSLYNVYSKFNTAKEMWDALVRKYKSEDAGSKKYAVAKFLNFKMVDSKPIMAQVEQLQLLVHEILAEGMEICETFQVAAFIEKLPPKWENFKNYLMHKRKAMNVEDLIVRLRVEMSSRQAAKGEPSEQKVNLAEHQDKGKKRKFQPQNANKKPQGKKFAGKCHNCNKIGHKADECRSKKVDSKKGKAQANLTHDGLTEDDLCAIISELNLVGSNPMEWFYDTGATRHICSNRDLFTTYKKSESEEKLFMGNDSTSKVEGVGKVLMRMTSGKDLTLNNVLHVPDIRKNLISGTLLSKHGFGINFVSDKLVLAKNGVFIGKGYVKDGLIKMSLMTLYPRTPVTASDSINKNNTIAYVVESSNIWHERLGHVNYKSIQRLMNMNMIPKYKLSKDKCEVCVQAKLTKRPSPQVERTTEPLGLIHTDLCDLKYVQTRGGKKYFVTFIDDSTKYCYVYLLRSKDEALDKFKEYKLEVENQLSKKIKIIRSDRGGEYNEPFNVFCREHGIVHQTTAPYSPESNGVAERKNRTLKEMMNALLGESGLAQNMWGEALLTSNYILNKIPNKVTGKTPYELWKGNVPSYKYLKVWGCLAKVAVPPPKKVTIGPKTVDCIFIGYAHNSSAYRFLVYKSDIPDIHVNTVMESRNASFFENVFPCKDKEHPKRTREQSEANTSGKTPEEDNDEPRRSKRARKEKSFGDEFVTTFLLENEPRTFKEAMSTPDAPSWKEAVKSEIDSIMQNHIWELVDLPQGCKALGCKWIFKRKLKTDGSIEKHKARLVVQGFRQKEGLDFFDTYSPVTRITSIRMLIAIAALRNLEIHQMDVKTAFLNGDLEEEIYMKQPEGYIVPGQENKVCRLVKSLYGLKQAPKQWHEKFDHVMMTNGFSINECDKCIYIKDTSNGYVLLCLYVDDMLIIGSNADIIKHTKQMLCKQFDMKDLGLADVILGIKITRHSEGIILSQAHYAEKILDRFKNYSSGTAKTPVDPNLHLTKNEGEGVSQVEYARVI